MNEKKGQWKPLSAKEIYWRHFGMYYWSRNAEEKYNKLHVDKKGEINYLLKSLLRKTSVTEAMKTMETISFKLSMSNVVQEYCSQEKFHGLLGISQVVNMTFDGLYFFSHLKEDVTTIMGRISLDFGRRNKLGLMLDEHKYLQAKVCYIHKDNKPILAELIEQIRSYSKHKRYPLFHLLSVGKRMKELCNLDHNPIERGISWVGNIDTMSKKDFDFFSLSRDKEDGGFFQYLCLTIFSIDFSINK